MSMYDAFKTALEQGYEGRCSVYEYGDVVDPVTRITSKQEAEVLSDIPCRRSYERLHVTDAAAGAPRQAIGIKLFLAPDVAIKPGSKLVVTQDGVTEQYAASGKPAVYPTHQEILLKLFERWA